MADDKKKGKKPINPKYKGFRPKKGEIPPMFLANAGNPNNPGRPAKASDEEIVKALFKTGGNIAAAARILGYSPPVLRKKIAQNPELRAAKNELRDQALDQAEAKLQEHIYEKDSLPALLEYLKAIGKTRGWGHQLEVKGEIKHKADDAIVEDLLKRFEENILEAEAEEIKDDE